MSTRSTRNRESRRNVSNRPLYQVGEKAGNSGNLRESPIHREEAHSSVGSRKRKRRKKISGMILVIIIGFLLVGGIAGSILGPGRWACQNIIEEFQVACNDLNVSEIISCMKPSMTNNLVKFGAAIAGEDILNQILELLSGGLDVIGVDSDVDIRTLFQTIQLEPKQYGFPAKVRCVKCKASFAGISQYINVYITKYCGDVYIMGMEFAKN